MSFEEYLKSDEGLRRIEESKRLHKRMLIISYCMLGALLLLCIPLIVFEVVSDLNIFPDERTERIYFWISAGLALLPLGALSFVIIFFKRQNMRSALHLKRAIMLFWRENPVPVDKFIKGQEMILNIETILSAQKGGYLKCLVLSSNGNTFTVPMEKFEGMLDNFVGPFLLAPILQYIEPRKERGETLSTLSFNIFPEGKRPKKKEETLIIKKGKVTFQGRDIYQLAQTVLMSEKEVPGN